MNSLEYKVDAGVPFKSKLKKLWSDIVYYRYIYLMLLPGIAFFVLFRYVPMYGIQLAFKNFRSSLGISKSPWIGLENFRLLLKEKDFLNAFTNTFIISFMKIGFGFPAPIILAILINELRMRKYKRALQTVLTFPHFLSWVILSGILMNLFASTGAVNNFLTVIGAEKQNFLMNKGTFRYLLVFTDMWKEAGWGTILYLAAIAGIDPTLYEAATVDGANRFHKIIYITWPGIIGMAVVLLTLNLGHIMEAGFEQVFNLYNAAVREVADIIDTYVYRISFQQRSDFGFSTAVGLFKGIVNLVLLLTANKASKFLGQDGIL